MDEPRTLRFSELRPHLEGLLLNVERDLHRAATGAQDERSGLGFVLIRIAVLSAININNSVRFLCADEDALGRRKEYCVIVPVLNRTLLETLITTIFILEDFPNRSYAFQRAAWREQVEELQQYRTEFAGDPKWAEHLKTRSGLVDQLATQFKVSDVEKKDPRLVPSWSVGSFIFDKLNATNRPFARWLDKWIYDEASSIAHFGPTGVIKTAPFLLHSMSTELGVESRHEEALPKFKFFHIGTNLILLVAIATELESVFALGNKGQIFKCWHLLREAFPDAEAVCKRRYDEVMKGW